jgi:hypothetical protein
MRPRDLSLELVAVDLGFQSLVMEVEMESIPFIVCLLGLAFGYAIVFAQVKKGGAGYFVVATFSLLMAAAYAWKACLDLCR